MPILVAPMGLHGGSGVVLVGSEASFGGSGVALGDSKMRLELS